MNTTSSNNLILPKYLIIVKKKGAIIYCVRTGGWGKHNNFFLGGAFRKAKYEIRRRRKNRNRKARAGKNSFPTPPFLFARPSVRFSAPPKAEQSVRILFKKGSSFVQQLRPIKTFQIFRGKSLLARPAFGGSRFAKSPVFRN